jgi:hypothetical protein
MQELWKPIPGEWGWFASSEGRVMRRAQIAAMPNGGVRWRYGTPSALNIQFRRGYWLVRIAMNGKTRRLSSLVCAAFHGPRPFPKAHCMHLDENSLNNRPENLRWGTASENARAPKLIAHKRSLTGDAALRRKLSNADVLAIRESGECTKKLAERYGVARGYVYQVLRGTARPDAR